MVETLRSQEEQDRKLIADEIKTRAQKLGVAKCAAKLALAVDMSQKYAETMLSSPAYEISRMFVKRGRDASVHARRIAAAFNVIGVPHEHKSIDLLKEYAKARGITVPYPYTAFKAE